MPQWKLDGVGVVEDVDAPAPVEAFDPGAHTAAEVKAYVEAHPDERAAILAAELAGKARVTLTEWLSAEA
jgi:hypothetical protein